MVMQVRRTLTVGATPTGLAEGQISVGMADQPPIAWVGVPASVNPAGVIPITGLVRTVAGAPQPAGSVGQLWWDEDGAQLYVYTGSEWVVAVNLFGGASVSFPASPAANQIVTDASTGATWRWDAPTERWVPAATGATFVTPAQLTTALGDYLPLSGGTMSGPLTLAGDAVADLQALPAQQAQLRGDAQSPINAYPTPTGWIYSTYSAVAANLTIGANGADRLSICVVPTGTQGAAIPYAWPSYEALGLYPNGNVSVRLNLTTNGQARIGNVGIVYTGFNPGNAVAFNWVSGTGLVMMIDGNNAGVVQTAPSDESLKDNIRSAEGDALAEINAIDLKSYDIKVNPSDPWTHVPCGVSAQQLRTVMSDAVIEAPRYGDATPQPRRMPETLLSVQQMPLISRLVGAVQQLTKRVEELEAKLA